MRRYWTKDDDEYLIKYYKSEGGLDLLVRQLQRTPSSITHRAQYLHVADKLNPRWTDEEDAFLVENYYDQSQEFLVRYFNGTRSWTAILSRIFKLNLHRKSRAYSSEEDKMIKAYYTTGEWSLGKPKRSDSSIRGRAVALGISMLSKTRSTIAQNNALSRGQNVIKSYGKVFGGVIGSAKKGAIQRSLPCDLLDGSLESMIYLDSIAKDKCPLSGMPLIYKTKSSSSRTASLDRINSSKGYIVGNVQWLHKDVNIAKQDMLEEEFILLCNRIAKQHPRTI